MKKTILLVFLGTLGFFGLSAQEKNEHDSILTYHLVIVYDSLQSKGLDSVFMVQCILNKADFKDVNNVFIATGSTENNLKKEEIVLTNCKTKGNEITIDLGKVDNDKSFIKVYSRAKGGNEIELNRETLK